MFFDLAEWLDWSFVKAAGLFDFSWRIFVFWFFDNCAIFGISGISSFMWRRIVGFDRFSSFVSFRSVFGDEMSLRVGFVDEIFWIFFDMLGMFGAVRSRVG